MRRFLDVEAAAGRTGRHHVQPEEVAGQHGQVDLLGRRLERFEEAKLHQLVHQLLRRGLFDGRRVATVAIVTVVGDGRFRCGVGRVRLPKKKNPKENVVVVAQRAETQFPQRSLASNYVITVREPIKVRENGLHVLLWNHVEKEICRKKIRTILALLSSFFLLVLRPALEVEALEVHRRLFLGGLLPPALLRPNLHQFRFKKEVRRTGTAPHSCSRPVAMVRSTGLEKISKM